LFSSTTNQFPIGGPFSTALIRLSPSDAERPTLQIIELLCNASDVVQELSLEDIEALAPLLAQPQRLPQFVCNAVLDYQDNKGTRGWDFPDRKIVPLAWKAAAGS
jgi:hypothetical protein